MQYFGPFCTSGNHTCVAMTHNFQILVFRPFNIFFQNTYTTSHILTAAKTGGAWG